MKFYDITWKDAAEYRARYMVREAGKLLDMLRRLGG